MSVVLVTGATGFLGREVVLRLIEARRPLVVLLRERPGARDPAPMAARLEAALGVPLPAELRIVKGDVAEPGLGLEPAERERLLDGPPVQIVHGAAEVRFDLPYEHMARQNVGGTEAVLGLAEALQGRGRLRRVDYVSTCYVAGDRTDLVSEADVDVGQRPRNDYERTKLEAELAVDRAKGRGLPVTVHRPSIIVGDSRTGKSSSFKVLYWPLKLYARGRFRTVFGRPDCPVDVVPVDFVADAIVRLLHDDRVTGQRLHLAAGPERQSTIRELAGIAEQVFAQRRVRYVDPDLYLRYLRPIVRPILRLVRPDVAERGGVYLPYLRQNPIFSVDVAARHLGELAPPRVSEYFDRIMRYAKEVDFGRRVDPSTPPSHP